MSAAARYTAAVAVVAFAVLMAASTAPADDHGLHAGIWLSRAQIEQLPMTGPAWQQVLEFADQGLDMPAPDQRTPEALAAYQKAEIDKWWPIIRSANIRGQQ